MWVHGTYRGQMRRAMVVIAFLVTFLAGTASGAQLARPYESEGEVVPATRIDALVLDSLGERE